MLLRGGVKGVEAKQGIQIGEGASIVVLWCCKTQSGSLSLPGVYAE